MVTLHRITKKKSYTIIKYTYAGQTGQL